ncbi:MAG TPA: hypothetical protein VHQ24_13070 [Lachnospiraceae bacterium]|nr:hypothetical protein [Lachnospiraceae bacterium]
MKKIIIGDSKILVEQVYPYRYDYGKGKEVLRIEVSESNHKFEELLLLKDNESSLQYYEDDALKNEYVGYYQDFSCSYQNGVYSIELTRISATDLKVKEIEKQVMTTIKPETCTLEELKTYQIAKSKQNLETYLRTNPITSACHGGIEKQYSITKEKQSLLTQMVLISQMALQAGVDYQPSWNAVGEACTYDWKITELQQLAFEIEAVVRPLVGYQQIMESTINAAKSKEEILAIEITF